MRQYFFPLVLLCGFALGACGDETRLIRPGGTEVLLQNPPTEVDILLVVDNSCSMEDEQEKLSQGFEDFVAYFDVADVDYHIAVATTDMDSDRGALVDAGGAAVIDNETDDAADVFQENVQVGVSGAAMERGLDAAIAALTEPMVSESSFLGLLVGWPVFKRARRPGVQALLPPDSRSRQSTIGKLGSD